VSDAPPKRTDKFPPTSRYAQSETRELVTPAGTTVVYLRRRLVAPLDRFVTVQEHRVAQGDRLDGLTARYLGDPEQFWRICDANGALWPGELEELARVVRITLPEGLPAPPEPDR
jgi:hypothetical protein